MLRIAAEIGYSETAFAVSLDDQGLKWGVRYFSPEFEVPFCGHATIALGAVLGRTYRPRHFDLSFAKADITVSAEDNETGMSVSLMSPPTKSQPISKEELDDAMALFGHDESDFDTGLPPVRIHGGANHLMIALKDHDRLAKLDYSIDAGREIMRKHDVVTIKLVHVEDDQTFVVRNAFASAGIVEDPATDAGAAAFAGYLRDQDWPHGGTFTIRQGEDMGQPCTIHVDLSDDHGCPVRVYGSARVILG